MGGESKNDVGESAPATDTEIKKTKKKKGMLSRLWHAIFKAGRDDFEKRLQHISKEESAVLSRITRRSHGWRRLTRHLIMFSVLFELIAVGCAIMTTRSLDLNWKMRALRVLPMFLLPALSFITYSALRSYTRLRDRKDHKTLEKLRAERQEKIDELKEKTNYYTTQQLIQKYDPDPAAKAAAASVLASKLGADSGLKVYVGDESKISAPTGKSNDVEVAGSSGLRNRKASPSNPASTENLSMHHPEKGMVSHTGFEGADDSQQRQLVVEHYSQTGTSINDGGLVARLAALLVGEDPTQSYALICGNCRMHNGLARKEDFPYIVYYCPHCNALNQPKQVMENVPESSSPTVTSLTTTDNVEIVRSAGSLAGDVVSASDSPLLAAAAGNSET